MKLKKLPVFAKPMLLDSIYMPFLIIQITMIRMYLRLIKCSQLESASLPIRCWNRTAIEEREAMMRNGIMFGIIQPFLFIRKILLFGRRVSILIAGFRKSKLILWEELLIIKCPFMLDCSILVSIHIGLKINAQLQIQIQIFI